MAFPVNVRSINRTTKVRVTNTNGDLVTLSPSNDTTVDIDDPVVQKQLGDHAAIGQWYVTGGGALDPAAPLTLTGTENPASAILRVQGAPNTHVLIVNRTGGAPSNGNTLLVTGNDHSDQGAMDSTFGISGYETGKGTIKVTHNRPVAGGTINDANASAISIRCNGVGTAAQGIFFDSEDGPTTGPLMNFRQGGSTVWQIDPNGDSAVGGHVLNDYFNLRRASEVQTMPDLLASSAPTLTSGQIVGTAAFARTAGTWNNIRFASGGTVSAVTSLKGCVWDASGALLATTAEITQPATNTLVTAALTSGVTLTANQQIYIGIAYTGTTLTARGVSLISGQASARGLRNYVLSRAASGYAGGTPGTLTSGPTSVMLWAELF